jgi:hypothetical protein
MESSVALILVQRSKKFARLYLPGARLVRPHTDPTTSTSRYTIRFLCLGVSHLVGQRDLECIDERARGLSSCVLTTGNLIPKNAGLSRGVNIYSLFGWRRE